MIEVFKYQFEELGEVIDFIMKVFQYDKGNRQQLLNGLGEGVQREFRYRPLDKLKEISAEFEKTSPFEPAFGALNTQSGELVARIHRNARAEARLARLQEQ